MNTNIYIPVYSGFREKFSRERICGRVVASNIAKSGGGGGHLRYNRLTSFSLLVLAIGLFFYACKDLEEDEKPEGLIKQQPQKQPPQKQDEQEQQKQQPLKKAKKLVAGNFTFELNDNSASKDANKTVWVYQGASIALTIENGQRTDSTDGTNKKLDFSQAKFQWAYRKRDAQEWISLTGNSQTGRVSIPEDARVGAYELKVSAQVEHEIADNSKSPYRFVVRKKGCLPPSSYNAPETRDQLDAQLQLFAGTRYIEAVDTSKMRMLGYIGGRGNNFNQPGIGCWDVSNVTSMENAFNGNAEFNQPIGDWDTSRVTKMNGMFDAAAKFNQPIGQWDISKVTTMWSMFKNAAAFKPADWQLGYFKSYIYVEYV